MAFNLPGVSTILSVEVAFPDNLNISALKLPITLWSELIVVIPFKVLISILSPTSPELSLIILIRGVPSDVLVDFIIISGESAFTFILPGILILFSRVSPFWFVLEILPFTNVISAKVEFAPPEIVPLIFIPPLVVISPSNITSPEKDAFPATLISSSRIVTPLETLKAAGLEIIILLPAIGAPSIWNVEAFVVVTFVSSEANLAALNM